MQNKKILDYTLLRPLGKGGMAEVWYAENEIGNIAAVKILNPDLSLNSGVVERFRNEAMVTVKLKHSNIRQVYNYSTLDGRPCMVMEYLEGADLSARMKSGERFTETQLRTWWNQLASALEFTHQRGVVHRDIKPSNIFIDAAGNVKLLDFGIAKVQEGITMTQTGATMGTLMYMSPEQVLDSKHIGPASDCYSLAMSFVHLLSGKAPYDSTTTSDYEIRKGIVEMPIDMTGVPPTWQNFLQPYLAKKPEQRPALTAFNPNAAAMPSSAQTANAAEETFVGSAPTSPRAAGDEGTVVETASNAIPPQPSQQAAPPPPQPSTPAPKKPKKKRKGLVIGLVIAALLLAGGGIAAWLLKTQKPKQDEKQVAENTNDGQPAEFFNLRGQVKSVRVTKVWSDDDWSETSTLFFEFDEKGFLIQGEENSFHAYCGGENLYDDTKYWTYDKDKDQLVCSVDGEERYRILPFRVLNHDLGDRPGAYLNGLFPGDDAQAFIDDDIAYAKKYPIPCDEGCEITKGSLDDFIYKMQYINEERHQSEFYYFQYDGNGNLTQVKHREEYYPSEWNERRQEEVYDFSRLRTWTATTTYTYDSQNRVTGWYSESTDSDGEKRRYTWDISYNEQGDVAKVVSDWNGERSTSSFSYEYDKQGNWTSRTLVGAGDMSKTTRVIEYY